MDKKLILNMDASELAAKIALGEITSLEATNTYIEQLEKINPTINCLVENRFELARSEAISADKRLQEGQIKGRLFGVPISMKESFDVEGMRTTGGLPYRSKKAEEQDADIVARLKAEGAIILGKTNTPVLCFCQETDNKLYGRTNNPWDITRTVGGSTGGEAALIAVGGAAVGIGADIGGSIRFPSHFNGIVGFKSGSNQVPDGGALPPFEHPLQVQMLGIGAMAKSVRDARLINEILAYEIPEDKPLNDFTINVMVNSLQYPANEPTLKLLAAVKDYLMTELNVVDEKPYGYNEAADLWQLIMAIDGSKHVAQIAFGTKPIRPLRELLREIFFNSSELHRNMTRVLFTSNLMKPSTRKVAKVEQTISAGKKMLAKYLDKKLVIMPVYHTPAPPHGTVMKEVFSPLMTYKRYMPYIAYANAWGLPSLIVPVGEDKAGLPIGIQIISQIGNEDVIFKLGEIIEREFRGYKRKEM